MARSKITLEPNSINNILTLRYNPTKTSQIPKKTWQDFVEKPTTQNVAQHVEHLIISNITKSIKNSKTTKASIALSGGVDSPLVLSLLKKTCPDVKINTISIKFAESTDESKHAARIAERFGALHHVVYVENYLKELQLQLA